MSKENEKFMSLYRTYEGLLRARGTDYREVEDGSVGTRMTIMRQMRNYLAHAEDPGFLTISPLCIKFLEQMVKEETLRGDIVKNHLISPAKGSVKEGTKLSEVIYKLAVNNERQNIPVYDDKKMLKGLVTMEKVARALVKKGDVPLGEDVCSPYLSNFYLVSPNDKAPEDADGSYYCCTKDGTMDTQYMGYVDI